MKWQTQKGFTLVEIIIVLAITSAMLIAFMATIASRISRERYSDTTKAIVDALRQVYSQVENVQNGRTGSILTQNEFCTLAGQAANLTNASVTANKGKASEGYVGRSGCAIYGKLLSFGESTSDSAYNVYDVIGRTIEFHGGVAGESVLADLKSVNADVLSFAQTGGKNSTKYSLRPAGSFYTYYPPSDAWLDNTEGKKFKGEILIIRSPASGAIHTYWLNKALDFPTFMADYQNKSSNTLTTIVNDASSKGYAFAKYLKNGTDPKKTFVAEDIDLCVNSGDFMIGVARKNNIRIKADGHNSSAVELVKTDSGDNKCQ